MEEKKTISIDQNLLQINPTKKKEKKVKSQKLAQVKPQSVKELLLQKLKEYKKQKKRKSNKNLTFTSPNSIISDSFMETIQKKRNKTEQNIDTTPMIEENPQDILLRPNEKDNTISFSSNTPPIESNIHSNLSNYPQYSNLKHSTRPTYREWKRNTQKITTVNSPIKEKVNISKKIIVGLNKTKKKVGIYLKNNKQKQLVDDNIIEMKKCKLKTLKSNLKKNNLIRYGTCAPTDLLREIYISSKLCGEVNNTNGNIILDNYHNDL